MGEYGWVAMLGLGFLGFAAGNLLTLALYMPQIKKDIEASKDALYLTIVKPRILALRGS